MRTPIVWQSSTALPEDGIVAEEFDNTREDAEYVWVLDPIDGTKSFITGIPLFGTLIGLLHRGKPAIGAIHQPILNELCIGDGLKTTLNGGELRVRECSCLDESVVL
ncbi:inositol monophosphatase family protein, partial [Verrucomicrobiota bacterium]